MRQNTIQAVIAKLVWWIARRCVSDRALLDELLWRTIEIRCKGPCQATDDWDLRDMLFVAGRILARRAGREQDLKNNPPSPVDKPV